MEKEGLPKFEGVPVDQLVGEGWRSHFDKRARSGPPEAEEKGRPRKIRRTG